MLQRNRELRSHANYTRNKNRYRKRRNRNRIRYRNRHVGGMFTKYEAPDYDSTDPSEPIGEGWEEIGPPEAEQVPPEAEQVPPEAEQVSSSNPLNMKYDAAKAIMEESLDDVESGLTNKQLREAQLREKLQKHHPFVKRESSDESDLYSTATWGSQPSIPYKQEKTPVPKQPFPEFDLNLTNRDPSGSKRRRRTKRRRTKKKKQSSKRDRKSIQKIKKNITKTKNTLKKLKKQLRSKKKRIRKLK